MGSFKAPSYERDISNYMREYKRAMQEVTERVASLSVINELDMSQAESLSAQIGYILQDLDSTTSGWVEEHITKAFKDGQARAILAAVNSVNLTDAARMASFSKLATGTLNSLISDTYQDLLFATQNTSRKVKSLVREVVSEQMRIKAAQQLGRSTMNRAIINDLTKKGLSKKVKEDGWIGIVDKAGRRWNLTTYADMVVRTKLQQSYIEGVRVEGLERGIDLAVISSHGASDACGNYEGAIISLNGITPGYPTYAELKASGEIFHPNCTHTVSSLRSPDLLPKDVRAKAKKATKHAAGKIGINYDGLKPPIKIPTKRGKIDKKLANQYNFVAAKNIKEANAWAANNLGIAHVDYKGYSVELANDVNQTLEILRKKYPEVTDTKWVTTIQARNKALYDQEIEYYSKKFIEKYGYSLERSKESAKRIVKRRTVKKNVYAQSTNHTWNDLEGICFNQVWAKDYEKISKAVKSDVASKWHPQGTENPASILTHEFGHQVDNLLKKKYPSLRKEVIEDIWEEYSTDEIAKGLSRYATYNDGEFFAEAFGEYIHNENPRDIASKVGKALDKAFKKIRK